MSRYLLIIAILESESVVGERQAWPTGIMVPLLMMQGILLLPARDVARSREDGTSDVTKPLLGDSDAAVDSSTSDGTADDNAPVVSGASLMDMAKDANFWLLSCVTMFGTGAGLTVINNIAQQVKAVRGRDASGDANLYIVLISVANCGGRLFWGFCSDRYTSITRCGWLTIISASTCAAMFIAAFSDIGVLVLACLWMGLSYGGYWAVMPGILAELYGTRWFAVAYSVVRTWRLKRNCLFSRHCRVGLLVSGAGQLLAIGNTNWHTL